MTAATASPPVPAPASGPRRSKRSTLLGRQPLGIAFVAPYAVFLAAVFAWPLVLAVWIAGCGSSDPAESNAAATTKDRQSGPTQAILHPLAGSGVIECVVK